MIAVFYFYKRKFTAEQLKVLFQWILLPILSTLVIIFLRMPSFSDITFTTESSKLASGGFGPNQVATILGFSIVIILVSKIFNFHILGNKIIDWTLAAIILSFGLITFSRGGMVSAIIAIGLGFMVSLAVKVDYHRRKWIILSGIIAIFTFSIVWDYVNDLSRGVLTLRYAETINSEKKLDLTHRIDILEADYEIFKDHPWFGVGPGMAVDIRSQYIFRKASAHTEFSRLLAEHGIFGLASLIILFLFPLNYFQKNQNPQDRIICTICISLALLTMFHSAMRLAMPGFVYGLAFITFKNNDDLFVESNEV